MLRIAVFTVLLAIFAGCYPPSYYDTWNARSVERYLDWHDAYYPDTYYYNPYYYGYPYAYIPFSLSLYYSYHKSSYDRPFHGRYPRWSPYDRHRYRGWWRR